MTQQGNIKRSNSPKISDEDMYAHFIETRDKEVLGELFRAYLPMVFGVCLKYLNEKSAAQDAAMEVFERLIKYSPPNTVKRFKPYLYVMTKNHCLMKLRGEKHYMVEISETDVEMATEMHPIDVVDQISDDEALAKCLEQLKDLQKASVSLFYLKNMSYSDISTELKIDFNQVKSNIQNGKRNLKNCIEQQQ